MKIIFVIISVLLFSNILSCSSSELRNFAFEITPKGGAKKRIAFNKYDDLHINHQLLKETPEIEAVFKFVWNYKDEAERLKGQQVYDDLSKLVREVHNSATSLITVFTAKDLHKLKIYKETEFGVAYSLEVHQGDTVIIQQFQVKPNQPYAEDLHNLINKIVEKKPVGFLEYLEDSVMGFFE